MAKSAWIADVVAGALALVVYTATLAPTITWRNEGADSGDLVAAAFTLGIPHPPGYPLYTLIAALFAHLPIGDPAHNVGFFSVIAAAGAVMLVSRSARALIRGAEPDRMAMLVGPAVALAFAFAPLFWSQAIIPEVYALNALFVAALFAALLSTTRHRVALASGILGLGLAHHFSIAFLIPATLILLANEGRDRSAWLKAGVLLLAPLSLYLYLPLRAAADPPINWGNPRTLESFLWTVTGALYRPYLFGVSSNEVIGRAALTARFLFEQFTVLGVALGLWGIAQMFASPERRRRRKWMAMALGLVLLTAYAILYGSRDSFVYLIPAFMIFALWIAYGVGDLLHRFASPWARGAILSALILFPAYDLIAHFPAMDASQDWTAWRYAQDVFAQVPPNAVIITTGDEHLFALRYYRYVIARESSNATIISLGQLQHDWYYDEIRTQMPSLPPSSRVVSFGPRVNELIDHSLQTGYPVYSTVASDWLADYILERQGDLYWIAHRRP